jgi:hypothetical protein
MILLTGLIEITLARCEVCFESFDPYVKKTEWQNKTNFRLSTFFVCAQVRSTACHAILLQFDISANALEIRAVQSPKCIV